MRNGREQECKRDTCIKTIANVTAREYISYTYLQMHTYARNITVWQWGETIPLPLHRTTVRALKSCLHKNIRLTDSYFSFAVSLRAKTCG